MRAVADTATKNRQSGYTSRSESTHLYTLSVTSSTATCGIGGHPLSSAMWDISSQGFSTLPYACPIYIYTKQCHPNPNPITNIKMSNYSITHAPATNKRDVYSPVFNPIMPPSAFGRLFPTGSTTFSAAARCGSLPENLEGRYFRMSAGGIFGMVSGILL